MKVKLQVQMGLTPISVEIEPKSQQELFEEAAFFSELPDKCGNCEGTNLSFSHRSVKGHDFYSIHCKGCNWDLQYGQLKDGSGMFQKGWNPPYKGNQDPQGVKQAKEKNGFANDDVPAW